MNEQIQAIIEQSYIEVPHERDWDATTRIFDKEKFAELIIQRVLQLGESEIIRYFDMDEWMLAHAVENYQELIKETFGIKNENFLDDMH